MKVGDPFSGCAIVASRLKADLGNTESGLSRADMERNEVSLTPGVSFPKRDASLSVLESCLDSCLGKALRPKSSCSRDGKGRMGGSVASGGIDGLLSSGLAPAVEGRPFCNLRDGEVGCWKFCEKSEVESMLMRREKRLFAPGVAFEARLDAVEMDQRFRFRKPSLRPPKLLERECVFEPRRWVFFGETGSS